MAGRYAYFTRKQAGILYGATKRGELAMSRKDIRRMYDLTEICFGNLSIAENNFIGRLQAAIDHLFAARIEMAQAELDGKTTYSRPHVVGHVHLVVTEANIDVVNDEIDLFAEVGDIIDEDVTDGFDWFVED
jgi:hypothetical protein